MEQVNTLNYRLTGSPERPLLLILHGLFGSMDNLGGVARHFAEQYQVLSVDLRNHGRSFHDDAMDYPVMAEDVLALLEVLQEEGKTRAAEVVVLGHSMGGKVAMQLAVVAPQRVRALVVADIAPVEYPPGHDNVIRAIQAYDGKARSRREVEVLLRNHVQQTAVVQLLVKNLMRSDQGEYIWRMNAEAIINNYDAIRQPPTLNGCVFSKPVLFIKGSESDYIQSRHKPVIMEHFPAAQLRVITGAGHWLHAQKPGIFNRVVERFLAGLQ